jgi:predicted glutamine amidotransferase
MCELFAANAKRPQTLNDQLTTFFGDSVMHPHGWGLAIRDAQGNVNFHKEAQRAIDSAYLRTILDKPVQATHLQAHIRYATAGNVTYDNSHPFVGTDATGTEWSFIHNGSIFHQGLIQPFTPDAQGTSDSERVLIFLLDNLNRAAFEGVFDFAGRFDVLAQSLAALSYGNKLNVVLDDGTYTYVHTNTEEYTLYYQQRRDSVLFCTRPLDEDGWKPLPKRRLFAFRDGKPVRVSEEKGGLYHFDKKQMSEFLLANVA